MSSHLPDLKRISDSFSSKHWRWFFYTQDQCPANVTDVLREKLKHIAVESWPMRLALGGAYINGLPIDSDQKLVAPCKLEYYETAFPPELAGQYFPAFKSEYIVYEDQAIIVAFKPAGLPCMPAREQLNFNLKSYLEKYCNTTVHVPSRLDMSTAGLVAISKLPETHNSMQKLYSQRQIDKYYLLKVEAAPESIPWKKLSIDGAIGKSTLHPVLRQIVPSGGKSAVTEFLKIPRHIQANSIPHPTETLLQAKPLTGRTHQIRVHISHLDLPIVGDNFYGGTTAPELCLLSYRLKFLHPLSKRRLDIVLPQKLAPAWIQTCSLAEIAGTLSED